MISKNRLEILLESCRPFESPLPRLEQYVTPAPIAADILNLAFLKGDILGKRVFDLGCGTGRLAIGAKLLGAREVFGFDIDQGALEIAKENALRAGAEVEWILKPVSRISEECDTVLQNPPFGTRASGADRPFLKAALSSGKVIYSMHKSSTRDFIREFISKMGGTITDISQMRFGLPRSYGFHKKEIKIIDVDIYRIERRE